MAPSEARTAAIPSTGPTVHPDLRRAAERIAHADVVIVGAGAGLGVDSGLPDFRGDEGFWSAYPAYERLGKGFTQMASPEAFHADPAFAWGFYGHRRSLYRATVPHPGFDVLRTWVEDAPDGGFVLTSNVDGHFQRAGIDAEQIVEVHGSIHVDQCLGRCGQDAWDADAREVEVDTDTMRAIGDLPACPSCGGTARPNVLMFGDWAWEPDRTDAQERRLQQFLEAVDGLQIAVVEVGAGTAVPTVRMFSEQLVRHRGAHLVRINPRDPEVPSGQIGIARGAEAALLALAQAVDEVG